MPPGPPKKPTHLKVLAGTRRADRENPNEPKPSKDAIGPTMPLSDEEREVWNQLVPELVRCGIMTNTDCHNMTMLCQAEALRRRTHDALSRSGLLTHGSTGQPITNPLFKAMLDAQDRVMRLTVEFGMTPAARARVNAKPEDETKDKGFGID